MSLAEIRSAFVGVLLLFRGRAEGLALMDRSVAGFWRSFLAILLVLPSDALIQIALVRLGEQDQIAGPLMASLPLLALDFAVLPVILAALARPLGLTRGYVDFVVARNWGAPVASAALALPLLLAGAGWLGPAGRDLMSFVLIVLVLRYQWMALRLALRADVPVAIALLVGDLVISLLLAALFTPG